MGQWVLLGFTFLSVAIADHGDTEKKDPGDATPGGRTYAVELTQPDLYNKVLKDYVFELRSRDKNLLKRYVEEPKFQQMAAAFGEKLRTEGILAFDGILWNNLGRYMNVSHHEASLMVADLWLQSLTPEQRARIQLPPTSTEYSSQEEDWKGRVGWMLRMLSSRNPQYQFKDFESDLRRISLTSGRTDLSQLQSDPLWQLFSTAMAQRGEGDKASAIQSKVVYWRNLGAEFMAGKEFYSFFGAGVGNAQDDRDIEWRIMKARGEKPMPDYKAFVEQNVWRVKQEEKPAERQVQKPVEQPRLTTDTVYDVGIPSNLLVANSSFNVRSTDGRIHRWTFLGYNANGPVWSYGGVYQTTYYVRPYCAGVYCR